MIDEIDSCFLGDHFRIQNTRNKKVIVKTRKNQIANKLKIKKIEKNVQEWAAKMYVCVMIAQDFESENKKLINSYFSNFDQK